MRLSQLFTRTAHQVPADEQSLNAKLLIRAGYIHKEMAGIYDFLPLGLRVLNKIIGIIRDEMNAIGGQELQMSSLQREELWQKTDRWDDKKVDIWFKSKLQNGSEVGLAWSHEEPIVDMLKNFVSSYRDLPICVYQFQTKLRNEIRAKGGILRTREFIMKDMYSLSRTAEEHEAFYQQAIEAYHKVFKRIGIDDKTFFTFASGGAFTQFSHEFQTLLDTGEDTVFLDRNKKMAVNEEVMSDEVLAQLGLEKAKLDKERVAEVGNIFNFGITKAEQLGLQFSDESDQKQSVFLGSYGIGVTRLMGVVAELFADDKGLVWPQSIAPAHVHLVALPGSQNLQAAEKLYQQLTAAAVEVIYDDRGESAGKMFADADLLGIPLRLVISEKTLADGGFELKTRTESEAKLVSKNSIIDIVKR
ncbi:prolyl-tRNA synthetase [Candidatus Saccharibacteria bacterium RIFCSPHIGHO2_12_FULL_47_17]|nr:MAG: prolyl-tRNA synthetase [Candidatus Saccharibacteria bacterium RIFCSPHIGHO2_12_FULL_47_17]